MSTRKSRLLKADSLQRALTNVTLGSSKESAAQPTLREVFCVVGGAPKHLKTGGVSPTVLVPRAHWAA